MRIAADQTPIADDRVMLSNASFDDPSEPLTGEDLIEAIRDMKKLMDQSPMPADTCQACGVDALVEWWSSRRCLACGSSFYRYRMIERWA